MAEEIENQKDFGSEARAGGSEEGKLDPVEALRAERDDFKDRLLRKQAEFENFKKRTDRERAEFVKFASAELMREVLNVLDSFELALSDAERGDGDSRRVLEGFDLIHKQLIDSLKRFGLETIEAQGQAFDPNLHQAVSTEARDGAAEGTVLQELRRGYLLNGRLLRPSMVVVAAAPSGGGDR